MAKEIKIAGYHKDYLEPQCGEIQHFANNDKVWEAAYFDLLNRRLENIRLHLPEPTMRDDRPGLSVLDVGSGLGGIDIMLAWRYEAIYDIDAEICLMDGIDDAPIVRSHSQTFNNMSIALDFQKTNGVKKATFMEPLAYGKTTQINPRTFNLIISFQSYCFHYEPGLYVSFVKACCTPDTVLIFDVRKDRPRWAKTIEDNFECIATILDAKKFERKVFKCRF